MTTPPDSAPRPPSAGHPGLDRFFDSVRSVGIVRTQDRWIGGVGGGLARRAGIDPLLMRGLILVLTIFFGLGLLLYGVAWLLLPEESDGRIHLQQAIRGDVSAGMVGASIFTVFGLIRPTSWFSWGWGGSGFVKVTGGILTGLAVAAIIVGIVVLIARSGGPRRPADPAAPSAYRSSTGAADPTGTTGQRGAAAATAPTGPIASSTLGDPMSHPDPAAPTPGGAPIPTAYPSSPTPQPSGYGVPTPTLPPPAAPAVAVAAPPAPPAQPRAKGPGAPMIATVAGLILFVIAGAVFASRYLDWVVPDVAAAAIGTILVLLGLGLVITGLRGRRSGTLGFFAIVGLVVLAPIAIGSIGAFHDAWPESWGTWRVQVSDKSWQPTTVAEAERGLESTAGNVRVDLRQLEREPVSFTVSSGAGNLDLILPEDASVDVEASGGAGEVAATVPATWTVTGSAGLGSTTSDSAGSSRTFKTSGLGQEISVSSGEGAEWHITLRAGAGNTTITTQKG